jgi:tetratricopeptide (TPR) repeat protein
MKFFNFHLMPYAHVDLDAIAKNGSAWDAFDAEKRGDYAKAIELWSRLLERQGNWEHGYARYYLANCYERLGQFDEAEKQYAEAVRIEPNDKLFSEALAGLREARKAGLISERSPD